MRASAGSGGLPRAIRGPSALRRVPAGIAELWINLCRCGHKTGNFASQQQASSLVMIARVDSG
jgi:hypothetical protein